MAIAGDDPMLLSEIDPDKVSRANKANISHINQLEKELQNLKLIGI